MPTLQHVPGCLKISLAFHSRASRAYRGKGAELRCRDLFHSFDLVKNSEHICQSQLARQGWGMAQPPASAAFRVHGNLRSQED